MLSDHSLRTKNEHKNLKKIGYSRYIYQNELDKVCFQYDIADGYFEVLPRRTASDKMLRNKEFNITKNTKHNGYQSGLASMVYNFFDKKASGGIVESRNLSKQELAEELHKSIIRKCEIRKV